MVPPKSRMVAKQLRRREGGWVTTDFVLQRCKDEVIAQQARAVPPRVPAVARLALTAGRTGGAGGGGVAVGDGVVTRLPGKAAPAGTFRPVDTGGLG